MKFDKRLIKVFQGKHKNIKFIDHGTKIKEEQFDFHLPLGDLGSLLRKNLYSFKNVKFPYIDFDKKIYNKVKKTFNSKKKIIVGISWTSKNEEIGKSKSIDLTDLSPILKLSNLTFLDLEYKNAKKDKEKLYEETKIQIYRFDDIDYFNDILAVTSIIQSCDLIVTCSNVNAHISGALGKKTFLLLPIGKGRLLNWSTENNHSVWYPSVNVFQQTKPGDWSFPINQIKEEILKCQNY